MRSVLLFLFHCVGVLPPQKAALPKSGGVFLLAVMRIVSCSHEKKVIYDEDAGLSHISLKKGGKLASMYRFHHNDPVYFQQKFNLMWRDGEELEVLADGSKSRKCIARTGNIR